MELRNLILAKVPVAEVTGQAGRRTSFEVSINGKLVFSKLKLSHFPLNDAIVEAVSRVAQGEEPSLVEECEQSGCTVQ